MYWENPNILLGLWVLPLVAWVLVHAHRKRIAAARAFVDTAMVGRLMPSLGGPRGWVKGILLLAGLGLLIVAGARPRFGVYTETVRQRGVDLFVLLDVSRSMTAEDVTPSRLERAKSDVRDLLPRLASDRVGLIVFAGKPVVKVPLTSDQGFFRMVLDEVDVHSAPRGGTLIGDAIRKAMETMPRSRDRDQVVVLITDGEDQDSYAEDAAKQAAERGVKIFTVGLGDSREGARIPVRDDSGRLAYLQDEGQEKWSKLNDQLLKQIALTTGGAYIPAGTRAYDLGQVYADHLADLTRGEYQAEKRKRYREQFQLFVCLGVALLLVEMGIASCVGQGTDATPTAARLPSPRSAALVLIAALLASPSPAAAGSKEAAQKVREGIAAYQAGDYKDASNSFSEADVAQPDDPRIAFDRGAALAAQGDADKATELLQKAALSPDLELAVRARYNLGCLAAAKAQKRFGEHPESATPEVRKSGLADLAIAVGHFRDCLHLDKDHADARHNLELIRLWIKSMESLWEQNDRKKQRKELDLAAFLQMLEQNERGLRAASRALAGAGDSPKLREAQRAAEKAQRKLGEEIGPLKEKIETTLGKAAQSAAGSGAPAPAPPAEDVKKAIAQLQSLADEVGSAFDAAATKLHAGKPTEAVKPQTEAVEKLHRMLRGVAPYPTIVGRALGDQQGLVGENPSIPSGAGATTMVPMVPGLPSRVEGTGGQATRGAPGNKDSAKPPGATAGSSSSVESTGGQATRGTPPVKPPVDAAEAAWNQDFVTRTSEVLAPLAKQGLEQLKSAPTAPAVPQAGPGGKGAPAVSAEEAEKQREGLKQSMEKAVQLAPKVEKLSGDAAQLLRDRKPAEALPKQQEALKLLKEIAEPLPKQKPEQNQDQDKPDQDKQEQKQQQKDQKQPDQKEQQQEASQQQAESAIRQVQERQQQRQEREKQLQRYLSRPGKVEKDW